MMISHEYAGLKQNEADELESVILMEEHSSNRLARSLFGGISLLLAVAVGFVLGGFAMFIYLKAEARGSADKPPHEDFIPTCKRF